jgi:hypothetical protein
MLDQGYSQRSEGLRVNRSLCIAGAIGFLAFSLAACSSKSPTPPPSGPFSDASLNGQYAFSLSGVAVNGAYFARVGSFSADGTGGITTGLEDLLNLSTGQPASLVSYTGGSYQIEPNGRGQITLNAASGTNLTLNLILQSPSVGNIVETDLNAATSGTLALQTNTDFANSALAHSYVFGLYGVSLTPQKAAPIALAGQIAGDGNGTITGGVMDTNDGTVGTPSGATAVAPGTYALDTNGNGTNFGRGMMTFNGRTYAFYIVDATHLKMVEEDTLGGSAGELLQQTGTIPTENSQITGSFVYLTAGASILGSQALVTRVARFTADGNGNLGTISLDDNNDGDYTHVSQGGNISAATYAMDTANSGSGRGTFTFKSSGVGTFADVFYLISSTQGVALETTKGIIGTGPMYAQTAGPFTLSSIAGNYTGSWNGVQLGSTTIVPFAEDGIGQYALASTNSSNISGIADYTQLGLSSKTVFTDVGFGGTLTINGDGTANNHYKYALTGTPSVTLNFQAYFVNPGKVLMICSDGVRTMAGMVNQQ